MVRHISGRVGLIAALALALVAGPALADTTEGTNLDKPLDMQGIANPGVLFAGDTWYVFSTGNWDSTQTIYSANAARGAYTRVPNSLLTTKPKWASSTIKGYWAPSAIATPDGQGFEVFYAAPFGDSSNQRCIGTGFSTSPSGPFVPNDEPIVCTPNQGTVPNDEKADDYIASSIADTIIDPTPTSIEFDGGGTGYYLIFKTGRRLNNGDWDTRQWRLRLKWTDLSEPFDGASSQQLTSYVDADIEENPVVIQRNTPACPDCKEFTLFTSIGWFGQADNASSCANGTHPYQTWYRQSDSLSGPWTPRKLLQFDPEVRLCGDGNAHVMKKDDTWRFFFNARYPDDFQFQLYAGDLRWTAAGEPQVEKLYTCVPVTGPPGCPD